MAKEQFREKLRLREPNQRLLGTVNSIVEEYADQGYKLTLRQLYYQLVSRDVIPNKQAEYAKLSTLLVKGRMAGVVDWSAIEDRIRTPYIPYFVTGVDQAIEDTIKQYRLNRQEGQRNHIEVWVEKDALSGVLRPITQHYHLRLMVNRGYSSCTAMYEAYRRFSKHDVNTILYLGDHDPSGLDMIRDVRDRLREFGVLLDVVHIAITKEQIEEYKPPPNPAKITDPRAKWYIQIHGNTSWEVDALNPNTLSFFLRHYIEELIDGDLFDAQLKKEETGKEKLKGLLRG